MKVLSLFVKKRNEDGSVVIEDIGLHIVKRLAKVIVGHGGFFRA